MKRVLVVEDEEAIREFEVINLQRSGYDVVDTDNGESALELFDRYNRDFDLAVLDIMLPGIDGMKVCKELRKRSDTIGIILLTAKTQEMDKISGLMLGADDYITKPFSPSELVARVDALYRRVALNIMRSNNKFNEEIKFGEFVLNLKNRALKTRGRVIELTQVEFQIMEYFFSNPSTVLSRTQILEHVWGSGKQGVVKIVDVNMRRLRMEIEDNPTVPKHMITVWGMGYKLEN